jgi:hypothetical protein
MVRGLVGALNLRKLGFFLLSAFASLVLCGLVFLTAMRSRHSDLGGFLLLLDVVMAIGFSGVVAGGVARMAYTESQGEPVGIAGAFAFCGRRFIPLFLSVVILLTMVVISFAMANGMILVVNKLTSAGAFLGGVLFIPQAVFNGMLVLVLAAAVLVPIAVAVEQTGALQAIRRLDRCARRYPGQLLFQCEITFFGLSLPGLMLVLLLLAVGTAVLTNGPSGFSLPVPSLVSGGSGNEEGGVFAPPRNPTREESRPAKTANPFAWALGLSDHGQSGDSIRWASLLLLGLLLLAYPLVYWICAFTFFYEAMLPFLRGEGLISDADRMAKKKDLLAGM